MARTFTTKEISLSKLLKDDQHSVAVLLEACISEGCFYLDISDADESISKAPLMKEASAIIQTAGQFFQSPLNEKLQWEMDTWGDLHIGG